MYLYLLKQVVRFVWNVVHVVKSSKPMRNDWEVFGLLAAFRRLELRNNFNGEQIRIYYLLEARLGLIYLINNQCVK